MNYTTLITGGVALDCDYSMGKAVGVDKDLILVNYDSLDVEGTIELRGTDTSDLNYGGLPKVKLEENSYIFKVSGTQNSIQPSFSIQTLEDGRHVFTHSVSFTVYNKTSTARKFLADLSDAKLAVLTVDRSTGLYEIFGLERGLRLTSLSRQYVGSQTSNYFQVSMSTPEDAFLKESMMPELASELEQLGNHLALQGNLAFSL